MVVIGHEITSRRNAVGIDYGLSIAVNIPNQRYVADWVERVLGSSDMGGVLLFTPEEYGRPVVVYDDGRLAYDPMEAPDGDDEYDDYEDDDAEYGGDGGYEDDPYGEYDDEFEDAAYEDDQ